MTNFIHMIPPQELKENIDFLLERLHIQYFVLDTVKGGEYKYFHNGQHLFEDKYRMIRRSDRYTSSNGARRYEEIWECVM